MKFWQGKKVLVTGHTGFKGSWLSLWLQNIGAEVIGIALPPPTTPSLFELAHVKDGMISIMGNIRNINVIKNAINEFNPEIIFHMAAQSLVRYSYQNPVETYITNVIGTVNLLECVRQSISAKVVINVTSDKCYENKGLNKSYREDDVLGGYDPYSNSKACAELVTSAYRNSYLKEKGVALATARAGNVIGGGDWSENRLIPDIIRAFLNKKSVLIRYPDAIRPWQHVLEPLSGYLLLAEFLFKVPSTYAEAWNFGSNANDVKTVSYIANYISSQMDGMSWIKDHQQHPHEAAYLKLDSTKAKEKLGWNSIWPLEKSLDKTIFWYKAYQAKKNMKEFTLSQIKEFGSLVNKTQKREFSHDI